MINFLKIYHLQQFDVFGIIRFTFKMFMKVLDTPLYSNLTLPLQLIVNSAKVLSRGRLETTCRCNINCTFVLLN